MDALYDNDSWALSMMSYFDQVENTSSSTNNYDYARLIGPMSVDWLALNNLYDGQDYVGNSFGVNQAFTGNTTWGFNTNITAGQSAAYNAIASLADTNAFTIVDGGGIDTVDFSGFAADQKINLLSRKLWLNNRLRFQHRRLDRQHDARGGHNHRERHRRIRR